MGNDVIGKLNLAFKPENKDKVMDFIRTHFEVWDLNHTGINGLTTDMECYDFDEQTINELKKLCDIVSYSEYEYLECSSFYWDSDMDETPSKSLLDYDDGTKEKEIDFCREVLQ